MLSLGEALNTTVRGHRRKHWGSQIPKENEENLKTRQRVECCIYKPGKTMLLPATVQRGETWKDSSVNPLE